MSPSQRHREEAEKIVGDLATQFNNCVAEYKCDKKKHDGTCCKMTVVGLAWGCFIHHKSEVALALASAEERIVDAVEKAPCNNVYHIDDAKKYRADGHCNFCYAAKTAARRAAGGEEK